MSEGKMICLSCPMGCELSVRIENGRVVRVEGNGCPRGPAYAEREAIEPMRVLPTSIKVLNGDRPLVSVKTDRPIPRRMIPAAMDVVRKIVVPAPVKIGDVVLADLLGTGAKLVTTRAVPVLSLTQAGDPRRLGAEGEPWPSRSTS